MNEEKHDGLTEREILEQEQICLMLAAALDTPAEVELTTEKLSALSVEVRKKFDIEGGKRVEGYPTGNDIDFGTNME